ncbi:hypothetical protein GGS20DRAFT_45446 [Poronia punctata]|nr:hypothetical protein GGS20DRAFT_45446 [Poronia punctata]
MAIGYLHLSLHSCVYLTSFALRCLALSYPSAIFQFLSSSSLHMCTFKEGPGMYSHYDDLVYVVTGYLDKMEMILMTCYDVIKRQRASFKGQSRSSESLCSFFRLRIYVATLLYLGLLVGVQSSF